MRFSWPRVSHNFWILTIIEPNANAKKKTQKQESLLEEFGIFVFATQLKQSLNLAHGGDSQPAKCTNLLPQPPFVGNWKIGMGTGLNAGSCIFDAKYKAPINST